MAISCSPRPGSMCCHDPRSRRACHDRARLVICWMMTTVDTVMCGPADMPTIGIAFDYRHRPGAADVAAQVGLGVGLSDGRGRGHRRSSMAANGRRGAAECGRIWRLGLLNALGDRLGWSPSCSWPGSAGAGNSRLWAGGADALAAPTGGGAGRDHVRVRHARDLPVHPASSSFLEGISRPLPGMIVMALANVVNAVLPGFERRLDVRAAGGWGPKGQHSRHRSPDPG